MTKEELLAIAKSDNRVYLERIIEFLDSNVVIPKGVNRVPYAGVLHKWIEGGEVQYLTNEGEWLHKIAHVSGAEYLIKPSGLVYEWQWYKISDGHLAQYSEPGEFMSEGEAQVGWKKFKATKRVRQ